MKRKFITVVGIVVFLSVINWGYSFAQEAGKTNPAPIETSTSSRTTTGASGTGTSSSSYVFNNVTYGCAAGALFGSIIPGFGNVIGCVAGGFVGWWFK